MVGVAFNPDIARRQITAAMGPDLYLLHLYHWSKMNHHSEPAKQDGFWISGEILEH